MTLVREKMTDNVKWASPDMALTEVARRMRDDDIGVVPIAQDDRLVGMVTDRDIVTRVAAETGSLEGKTASDAMSSTVLYCYDDQACDEIAANMARNQVRRLPVVNRDKRLVGIVSLGDLSHAGADAKAIGEAMDKIATA